MPNAAGACPAHLAAGASRAALEALLDAGAPPRMRDRNKCRAPFPPRPHATARAELKIR